MATQTSKIKKKIAPPPEEKKENPLKPKESRDLLLIVLMVVTVVIMILGVDTMDEIGYGMYSSMLGVMITTYINRHVDMSDKAHTSLQYVTFFFMALVLGLMAFNFYLIFTR